MAQKNAALAAAEARVALETTGRAEYEAKLFQLTETLHLDSAPLALRMVLPLARVIRRLSILLHVDADRVIRLLARLLHRDAAPPSLPNSGSTGAPEPAEPPPKTGEGVKTDITARVLQDAEVSLRLLGSLKAKPGKD
jgi:hypothetical protein